MSYSFWEATAVLKNEEKLITASRQMKWDTDERGTPRLEQGCRGGWR